MNLFENTFLIKAAQLLLSLSLLIVLHEGGHYVAARIFKTRVEKFFLFFDIKFALFKKKIGDTVYGIGWLPLGGYVKIAGMIDESMDTEQMQEPPQPWEFRSKPTWQRLIIMLGGVTVNLVLGFVIYMMILFVWGQNYVTPEGMPQGFAVSQTMKDIGFEDGDYIVAIDGKPLDNMLEANRLLMLRNINQIETRHADGSSEILAIPDNIGKTLFERGEFQPFLPMPTKVIDSVMPGTPADLAGLKKGDELVSVNGKPLHSFVEFNALKSENPGAQMQLEIQSAGGAVKALAITPDADNNIGVYPKANLSYEHKSFGFSESISAGMSYGYWTLYDYVAQMKFLFTKKGASQLGGFGTIGNLFPPVWDWQSFWATTAFISIVLAFMNILPIPALDGGHVMFLLYEMITGRKPNDKVLEYAQMIGIILLLGLVLYANGNDIYRYFFEK